VGAFGIIHPEKLNRLVGGPTVTLAARYSYPPAGGISTLLNATPGIVAAASGFFIPPHTQLLIQTAETPLMKSPL
jgi:hypothetical protein